MDSDDIRVGQTYRRKNVELHVVAMWRTDSERVWVRWKNARTGATGRRLLKNFAKRAECLMRKGETQ